LHLGGREQAVGWSSGASPHPTAGGCISASPHIIWRLLRFFNLQGVAEALVEALRRAGGGTVVMCDTEASQLDPKPLLLFHQTCAAHSGMCVCLGMACVGLPA